MNIINKISGLIQRELSSATEESFGSLSDAYTQLQKLNNIQSDNSQSIQKLLGIIRLTAISQNLDLNEKLVDNGIDSITKLAIEDISNLDDIDRETLKSIRNSARNYFEIEKLLLSQNIIGESLCKQLSISDDLITTSLSAFSPAAYLIDLIWFIQTCFFPDINSMERRFYRSLSNFPISNEEVDKQVYQIEIANKVIEKFVLEEIKNKLRANNSSELNNIFQYFRISRNELENISQDRNQLYISFSSPNLNYPNPQVINTLVNCYLNEIGTSREELDQVFLTKIDPGRLNQLIGEAGLSIAEFMNQMDELNITEEDFRLGLDEEQKEKVINTFIELLEQSSISGIQHSRILNEFISTISIASRELIDDFLKNLFLDKENKEKNEEILKSLVKQNLLIKNIEELPDLVRVSKTKGQFPNIPQPNNFQRSQEFELEREEYKTSLAQAELAINRIKECTLESIRENLLHIALKISLDKKNTEALGDYLYTDLSTTPAIKTTLVANTVEALHSFILSFQLSIEEEYTLKKESLDLREFEKCLQWLQSYSLWHSTQMVYLYPENFLLPSLREDVTEEFKELLNNSSDLIEATSIEKNLQAYKTALGLKLGDHPISRDKETINQYVKEKDVRVDPSIRDEWYLYIPLLVAHSLNSSQNYRDAANWLHCCYYPFSKKEEERFLYRVSKETKDVNFLEDFLDPYKLIHIWEYSIEKHLIIKYVQNLLDWADHEFIRETQESVARARELYELAGRIIENEGKIFDKKFNVFAKTLISESNQNSTQTPETILRNSRKLESHLIEAEDYLIKNTDTNYLIDVVDSQPISIRISVAHLLAQKLYSQSFYVPPNPIIKTLESRIKANLEKIRSSCNFTGIQRKLPNYSSPADPLSIIQQSKKGISLRENIPGEILSNYRFSYLIERARYYVSIAQQLEILLLQSYEKFDAEQFNFLKAKQDLKVTEANLALQELRVNEATDGCILAQYQRTKSEFQHRYFDKLIQVGLSEKEKVSLDIFWESYDWGVAAGFLQATMSGIEGGISGGTKYGFWGGLVGGILGGATGQTRANSEILSKLSQGRAMQASFERREQEWNFQRDLAQKDVDIGKQGENLATRRKMITEQERDIAQLQSSFASEVINFLETKFTSKDLWNWMSDVVKQFYRVHLNFATQTALMAQSALAFERQESLTFIAPYYGNTEKRDLLAAEQLLADINRLDQHRLTTERRRKELTKTISLASVAPIEFQQMRQVGWMTFATLMDWFDRDFPGHYMRLIKSVSLTLIGLIPPSESIHATLQNNGLSEVMVGLPWREYKTIHRQPESISITAASSGTGLFERNYSKSAGSPRIHRLIFRSLPPPAALPL